MDWRPPGSSVHGIFQGRILEWVAISYSRGSSQSRDLHLLHWEVDSLPLCLFPVMLSYLELEFKKNKENITSGFQALGEGQREEINEGIF